MAHPPSCDNQIRLESIFPWDGEVVDRLDAMTTFLAVVDAGSFSAASRKLRVPVTTVSRRVAELETHLRTQLLQRTTRKLSLTDAGAAYLEACRRVMEQIEEAERVAAGEYQSPRGELVITAPLMMGRMHIVPIVAEFMAQYVDIRLTCRFSDRVLDLQDDRVDVAVRLGDLPDSRHRARRVGTIHRTVSGSSEYLARHGEPHALEDLAETPMCRVPRLRSAGAMAVPARRADSGYSDHVPHDGRHDRCGGGGGSGGARTDPGLLLPSTTSAHCGPDA